MFLISSVLYHFLPCVSKLQKAIYHSHSHAYHTHTNILNLYVTIFMSAICKSVSMQPLIFYKQDARCCNEVRKS